MRWMRNALARLVSGRVRELEATVAVLRRECEEAHAIAEAALRDSHRQHARAQEAERHIEMLHAYRESAGMCWVEGAEA